MSWPVALQLYNNHQSDPLLQIQSGRGEQYRQFSYYQNQQGSGVNPLELSIVPYRASHTSFSICIPRTREVLRLSFVYVSSHNNFFTLHPHSVFRYSCHHHKDDRKDRTSYLSGSGTSERTEKKAHQSKYHNNFQYSTMKESDPSCSFSSYDPIEKVIYTKSLLHHILTFVSFSDLLSMALTSNYCSIISRSDSLWKAQCIHLWKDKAGMPLLRKEKSIAPFWRTYVTSRAVKKMSVKDIKGMFAERPLGRRQVRDLFVSSLEKEDMQEAVLILMPKSGELGSPTLSGRSEGMMHRRLWIPIDHLWFGSFLSSVVDSRRSVMLLDELLSRKGFMMYIKVMHQDYDTMDQNAEMSLHYHCKCFFDEDESGCSIRMEESDELHPQNLKWRWIVPGQTVLIGMYPPLVVQRLDNWGWQLENHHVVLTQ